MCYVRHSFISVIGVCISINNPTKIHERRIYTSKFKNCTKEKFEEKNKRATNEKYYTII